MDIVYCVLICDHVQCGVYKYLDSARRERDHMSKIYSDARIAKCLSEKDELGHTVLTIIGVVS